MLSIILNYKSIYFALASFPVVFIGIVEDFRRLHYKIRFIFMITSAIIAISVLDAVITNLGILELPYLIAVPFTIFAIVGVINAFNIIDGLNGLSSGIALISLASFYYLAGKYDLIELKLIILILLFSILGFFVLNFPFGKIFLGDSGSYFLGFSLAVISILLINLSNGKVSPWFPSVVLFIPIWETLFSIYRRKREGKNPFIPDNFHIHQLVYSLVKNNPLSSLLILVIQSIITIIAVSIYNSTSLLIIYFIFLVTIYILSYNFLNKEEKLKDAE